MYHWPFAIDRNTDYMAFGFSGSLTTYRMMGADIVVCDFKENHRARAIDYYINGYSQVLIYIYIYIAIYSTSSPGRSNNFANYQIFEQQKLYHNFLMNNLIISFDSAMVEDVESALMPPTM